MYTAFWMSVFPRTRFRSRRPVWAALCLFLLSARGDAEKPTTFRQFLAKQQMDCQKLADSYNAPVDWHIVLDVSGSYSPRSNILPGSLVSLTKAIPFRVGDSLRLDTFSEHYAAGRNPTEITSDWIRILPAGNQMMQNALDASLAPLRRTQTRAKTDIEALVAELLTTSHESCQPGNVVYIVLTDGLHDPVAEQRPRPLFFDSASSFIKNLVSIPFYRDNSEDSHKRFRGLLFVVHLTSIADPKHRAVVEADWRYGMGVIHDRISERAKDQEVGPLQIILWEPSAGSVFTPATTRRISRLQDVFPCISGDPQTTLQVPVDIVFDEKDRLQIPLFFLASGRVSREFAVTVRGTKRGGKQETIIYGPFPWQISFDNGSPYQGWQVKLRYLDIPISSTDLRRFPLRTDSPWVIDLAADGLVPDLRLNLAAPDDFMESKLDDSVKSTPAPDNFAESTLVDRFLEDISIRGQRSATMSLLAYLASMMCVIIYTCFARVEVAILGETARLREGLYGRRHFRFRRDTEILAVARQAGPDDENWLKQNHVEIDVVPVMSVVYHIVYYYNEARKRFGRSSECEQIMFNNISWLFYWPKTFWSPRWNKDRKMLDYDWESTITIPAEANGSANLTIATTIHERWWELLYRVAAVGFACMSFAHAVCAIVESFEWYRDEVTLFWVTLVVSGVICIGLFIAAMCRKGWLRGLLVADYAAILLLNFTVALATFLAFAAVGFSVRWIAVLVAVIGWAFSIVLFDKMRDAFVQSRIEKKKPVGVLDLLLEAFVARICA